MPINKHRWTKSGGGGGGGAASSVPASGVTGIADNVIVRGDNLTGIQGSTVFITDAGIIEAPPAGTLVIAGGAGGNGVLVAGALNAASFMGINGGNFFRLGTAGQYSWSDSADGQSGSLNLGIGRTTTGVAKITDGSTGLAFLQQVGDKRVPANQTVTDSATLANSTDLTLTLAAGRTYVFTAELYFTTTNTSGVKVAMGGTATHTSLIYDVFITSTSTPAFGTTGRLTVTGTGVGLTASGTAAHVSVKGTTTINAGGTFLIQFAQNAETGAAESAVLLRGSSLTVRDVA